MPNTTESLVSVLKHNSERISMFAIDTSWIYSAMGIPIKSIVFPCRPKEQGNCKNNNILEENTINSIKILRNHAFVLLNC